jgi:hypothetical protein
MKAEAIAEAGEGMTGTATTATTEGGKMKIETAVAEDTGLTEAEALERVGDEAGREVREVYRRDGVTVWEDVGMPEVKFLETQAGFQTTSDIGRDFPEIRL